VVKDASLIKMVHIKMDAGNTTPSKVKPKRSLTQTRADKIEIKIIDNIKNIN